MEIPDSAVEFVKTRDGVEAVIQRIGLNTTQVNFVAEDGEWLRIVVPSVEIGRKMSKRLRIEAHDGYPDHIRLRMGNYQRPPEDWAAAPYPERSRNTST